MAAKTQTQINIIVRDSFIDPDGTDTVSSFGEGSNKLKVFYKKRKRPLYHVWIYLEGADLPFVESVTYHLHKTFKDPVKTVTPSLDNPSAKIDIWTWGVFNILAEIKIKKAGRRKILKVNHELTYGNQLERFRNKIKPIRVN